MLRSPEDGPPEDGGGVLTEERTLVAVVGGHPVAAAGLANALRDEQVVVVDRGAAVVVADLSCPGCSPDLELLRRTAASGPLVVLAGTAMLGTAEQALAAGALGAVAAWEPVSELSAAIDAAARGGQHVSPTMRGAVGRVQQVRGLLSQRELEVLALYAADLPVKSVARRMDITTGSAKEYLKRLRHKLAAHGEPVATKLELRVLAEEFGLLRPYQRCAVGSSL